MDSFCINQVNKLCGRLNKLEKEVEQLEQSDCSQFGANYNLLWRYYDGSGNNLINPDWGKANTALLRKSSSDYADNVSTLAVRGAKNPSPRKVSNAICKSTGPIASSLNLTDMCWGWGQFLDHEIDLTKTNASEHMDIVTDPGDPNESFPNRTISIERSNAVVNISPREQPNQISSYIDATNVYGYSTDRAYSLRRLDDTGKLKTTIGTNGEILLPFNQDSLDNAAPGGSNAPDFYLAGDIRANENVLLTALHTLFMREHNRLCDQIAIDDPSLPEELIYQHARRIVIGIMQNITMIEFAPFLIGTNTLSPYTGYDESANVSIATEFSTVGYRLGHSMISSNLKIGLSGTLSLIAAFFNPSYITTNGIEDLLLGAVKQIMQEIDGQIVDELRDSLFGPPTGSHLLDLATLNIQRGRDHGIPGYNDVREAYGLSRITAYSQITSNSSIQTKLDDLYDSPDNIDPWIGCMVEDHVSGAGVGPLLVAILKDQFERLRDGDRFWFENDLALSDAEKAEIRGTKLSDVIIRNTDLTSGQIQDDVFHL